MAASTVPKATSSQSTSSDEEQDQDDLTREFEAASTHLRSLTDVADASTLLFLYARYKRATEGRCNVPKPGLFDFRGKQKWEAWKALGDFDRTRAMVEYVAKIKELDPKWKSGDGKKVKGKTGGFGVGVSRPVLGEGEADDCASEWLDAVKDGNFDLVKTFASSDPEVVKEKDENGMTALHWASDRGHSEILQWLIKEAKLDTNAQDASGQTPLHFAYACGHQDVIAALVTAGADESIRDSNGDRPVDLAGL